MKTRRTRRRLMRAVVGLAVVGAASPTISATGSVAGLGAAPATAASPACSGGGIAGFSSFEGIAAASNPELSIFVEAVNEAGLTDMLGGDEQFTIFAPNNAAFEKIPTNVLEGILADNELLTSILTYHVVPESLSSAALAEAGTATTLNGGELRFALDGQALTINGYEATVVCADVAVAKGTVHVIDSLLLPTISDLVEGVPSSAPPSVPTTTTSTTTTASPTAGVSTTTTTTPTAGVSTTTTTTTTPTAGVSPTSDPGGTTTSLAAGGGGGTLPGTGSSSVAQHIAQAAALLLVLGGLVLAFTHRRWHA